MKLIIGCNYHTTWQAHKAMRFVLSEIDGDRARLTTRTTGKSFWTKTSDLIFIETAANKKKAKRLHKLDKRKNVEKMTEIYKGSYIDIDPEKTKKVVEVLKDDFVPY